MMSCPIAVAPFNFQETPQLMAPFGELGHRRPVGPPKWGWSRNWLL